jgi:antirestriction protein ArdC
MEAKKNVYEIVAEQIIKMVEAEGVLPWHKPWKASNKLTDDAIFGEARSWSNGRYYKGINQFILGFGGQWATAKQIFDNGGHIVKGCKATPVVFWSFMIKDEKTGKLRPFDENKDKDEDKIPFLRYINVFKIGRDTTDIEEKEFSSKKNTETESEPKFKADEYAEEIINNYVSRETINFTNVINSNRAFYAPFADKVVVPNKSAFENENEYYSTVFHELTHSTGAKSRLNRDGITKNDGFGNEKYSKEELVAEMGAAMLLHITNLNIPTTFTNNVAYIQGWLKQIKEEPKILVFAPSQAEKAVKYILNGKEK